ncbi:MAG: efflux RND transporter periplasmic adaptor subunit, partial [Gammaproteobacteria bacterium]
MPMFFPMRRRAALAGLVLGGLQVTVAAQTPPVVIAQAERRPIVHEVRVTGSVVSPRVARLSSEVAGQVETLHVELGDRVEAGATLVTLDAELARIALEAARAATREARAARDDAERRRAEAERLTADRTIAETELRARRAEVAIAAATVEVREAGERREAALLARHTVVAPFAGAVSQRMTQAGEWLEPGVPVIELTATTGLRLDFEVPQALYPRITPALPLTIELDAVATGAHAAHVVATVPRGDLQSRTFLMLTRLDEDSVPLIPGMSARALLSLAAGRDGITVPRDALLRYPDGRVTVWVVEPDEAGAPRAAERRVEVGRAFAGLVEVSSGL